jgi:hypothetical protein
MLPFRATSQPGIHWIAFNCIDYRQLMHHIDLIEAVVGFHAVLLPETERLDSPLCQLR